MDHGKVLIMERFCITISKDNWLVQFCDAWRKQWHMLEKCLYPDRSGVYLQCTCSAIQYTLQPMQCTWSIGCSSGAMCSRNLDPALLGWEVCLRWALPADMGKQGHIHRLTLQKGVYSFRYFLLPMCIPDLQTFGRIMMEVGICIGDRKYLNEYTPYWRVSLCICARQQFVSLCVVIIVNI